MATFRHRLLQWAFLAAGRCAAVQQALEATSIDANQIAIVTGYTTEIAGCGAIAAVNKRRYAEKHGYHFRCLTSGFAADRPASWSKIVFIRRALQTHRFVFWTDADALIVNDSVRLESLIHPGVDVHLTRALTPFPHINAGHLFFRASPLTSMFLRAVWSLDVFTHDPTWEQRAINHLMDKYAVPRVMVSPNRLFNSFGHVPEDPDPYQDGDFIIHFPGRPDKLELMRHYGARLGQL